jgi:hypothetical protein
MLDEGAPQPDASWIRAPPRQGNRSVIDSVPDSMVDPYPSPDVAEVGQPGERSRGPTVSEDVPTLSSDEREFIGGCLRGGRPF